MNTDTITRAAELYHDADDFIGCLRAIAAEFDDPQQVLVAQVLVAFLDNREGFDKLARRRPVDRQDELAQRGERALRYLLKRSRISQQAVQGMIKAQKPVT